ncbi:MULTISPECIES: archaetidylserine decarboxylase [Psychrobacter]|uniref:Phosphatidylserine decarboxylase proenzyme n=1 Tax=Psychrobacter cryohalolentis (strain ATCC BAA-1226 / DSM 17306 / VKM B-2378 / K5) TaxID=335284 RepID=PSD_PSYCK|nr:MULTISPECIES: archaetidylserine decarboxylase [Psychrobacter]Q1Q8K8.1 RecName: Full=Phosphatidylserine decarboxylase proenzyme; Contains: RecName: Full=Phosphatidylserine decarboxylase alpha chain; Contains: RecName: Full=Phosphatidylserine decarboxylase beta chain [Psychrobacter cryohalolentis K5]ABE75995.1 Phosphatidylserine decarboxylase [Psychrobacter cryohalolentis K5]AGP49866.1 phosphatidylserine decarboxylase [Psychrobacter sp. G]ASE26176.1 phosphatidylserine decarboxylase proenzyme [|tara:strand:+ start:2349 stop:3182 length:834 start_codon:yes stop_codon:yes gene_type:complete
MNVFTTLQQFVPQQKISKVAGRLAASRHPWVKRTFIRSFAKAYDVSLDEYERQSLNAYESFNDFFTRELQDNARIIDASINGIVSPADGMISQLGQIHDHKLLQAKGRDYDIGQLLADSADGDYFADGSFATVYLAPSNYHRVHMPFDGILTKTRYVPGTLFSVNNTTAANVPDLFARNERLVCLFDTAYGKAAVVMVGAMIVAGIETVATGKISRTDDIQEADHDMSFKKGDELGRFYLGSTAIVVLPKAAKTDWQDTMQHGSIVQMGQLLGSAKT